MTICTDGYLARQKKVQIQKKSSLFSILNSPMVHNMRLESTENDHFTSNPYSVKQTFEKRHCECLSASQKGSEECASSFTPCEYYKTELGHHEECFPSPTYPECKQCSIYMAVRGGLSMQPTHIQYKWNVPEGSCVGCHKGNIIAHLRYKKKKKTCSNLVPLIGVFC